MKDLQIFEDTSEKTSTSLPDFEKKPTLKNFLATIQKSNSFESNNISTDKLRSTEKSKFQSGRALKLTAKAKKRENLWQKQQKTPSTSNLIIQLSKLFETNWEDLASTKTLITNCFERDKEDKSTSTDLDSYKILAIKFISKANTQNQDQFAYSTQLDIEEPETYNRTMNGSYSSQWSWAMREKLDQLEKNKT